MMKPTLVKISPGEAEILELFWEYQSLTLPKAYEVYLAQTGKTPTYSTIQTRLNRMVEKGLLHRNLEFPAVYTTVVVREQVQGKYFELLDELAGKNLAPLMLHLFEKRSLTQEEITTMKSILKQLEERDEGEKTVKE
ncbi:MAG: BlaI/MecI/CopY family transcriptional regulator [Thermoguttaceae bacterium]